MSLDHESRLFKDAAQLFGDRQLPSSNPIVLSENLSPLQIAQQIGTSAYAYFVSAAERFQKKGMFLEEEVFATRARKIREDMIAQGLTDPKPKIDSI